MSATMLPRPTEPVRVLHVVFSLQPGGMEYGVVKLVNGLDGNRVRASICSTMPAGALKGLVTRHVPVFELQRREGNDLRLLGALYRLFKRERPHIVHTHGWGTLIEGLVAARLARVPFVVHGEHGTLQLRPHQRWLQRLAWTRADRVLSVSARLADRMVREMGIGRDRVEVIRNGVDLDRFGKVSRTDARHRLALNPDTFVVGTVGRLVPVKDHATLVDAVARLRRQGLDVTLVIAGDGPLRTVLAERADRLGIASHVRLLGHRTDTEYVLAALDLFVLSSVSEGLPNTILEAMASGVPVVSTRVGGAEELVRDRITGLLVPPGYPGAMAAAIDEVLQNGSLAAAMASAGRTLAEQEFALDRMLQRYESLYQRVALGSRS